MVSLIKMITEGKIKQSIFEQGFDLYFLQS